MGTIYELRAIAAINQAGTVAFTAGVLVGPQGTQAIFTGNDDAALDVMLTLNRMGVQVPEDLAVVGFDDVPEAAFYTPPLTTVRQPLTELGAVAVEMLNQILSDQKAGLETQEPQASWSQPRMVIRGSSTRAK